MSTGDAAFQLHEGTIVAAIPGHWDVGAIASVRRHGQGMNSMTWLVTTPTGRWIAKAVPESAAAQFDAGLVVAARLEAAGLPAGAPFPTIAGAISIPVAGCRLALLRYVDGHALNRANPNEQGLWGATLARAHALLQSSPLSSGVQGWHWVDPAAPHLDIEPWVRPAVRAAVARLHALQQEVPLTYGILHADPAPEAFLVERRGSAAIIDWGSVTWGPLLYDIASVRLYAGDERIFANVLAGYLDIWPLPPEQLIAIPDFLRFRWAVQADYFARRIQTNDLTGIAGPSENVEGLMAARRFLLGA
ncbi:MAG TPA: phosphotransferase [Chloroflexota bacterium]|jgi:homoserine kinase type II|nr:phosphotransferase [Chloroflexota bacterium]